MVMLLMLPRVVTERTFSSQGESLLATTTNTIRPTMLSTSVHYDTTLHLLQYSTTSI